MCLYQRSTSPTKSTLVQYNAPRFPELRFARESENRHHVYVQLVRGRVAAVREIVARPAVHQVRTPDGAVLCTVTAGPALPELMGRAAGTAPPAEAATRRRAAGAPAR